MLVKEEIMVKVRAFPLLGEPVICDFFLPKGADIRALVERLQAVRPVIKGEPLFQYSFIVNGTVVPAEVAERTVLCDGDEVSMVPMLGGG